MKKPITVNESKKIIIMLTNIQSRKYTSGMYIVVHVVEARVLVAYIVSQVVVEVRVIDGGKIGGGGVGGVGGVGDGVPSEYKIIAVDVGV